MQKKQNDDLIIEAEFLATESELKHTINKGFKICCPRCHSTEYDPYHTPSLPEEVHLMLGGMMPEEDIHWQCKKCGKIWNSEFLKNRYANNKKSNFEIEEYEINMQKQKNISCVKKLLKKLLIKLKRK